ncbi:hypothetical protein [Streptomyces sp. NPDC088785]|uniref:hypothetical protein n=1 Tax=Streptomyces sp. NPDC088785 TaxID=3365897 RepID=UPI00382CBEFA
MPDRRRCPRGHFAPTAGTCRCARRSYLGQHADMWGQRLHAGTRVTTIPLAGNRL